MEAVRLFPVIVAPRGFLREPDEIRAGDMVVVTDLAAAHAAEKALGVVRVDRAPVAL